MNRIQSFRVDMDLLAAQLQAGKNEDEKLRPLSIGTLVENYAIELNSRGDGFQQLERFIAASKKRFLDGDECAQLLFIIVNQIFDIKNLDPNQATERYREWLALDDLMSNGKNLDIDDLLKYYSNLRIKIMAIGYYYPEVISAKKILMIFTLLKEYVSKLNISQVNEVHLNSLAFQTMAILREILTNQLNLKEKLGEDEA